MTDEQRVKAKHHDAHEHWKAAEQALCQIIDGKGNELGVTQRHANEPYANAIARAWADAAQRLEQQD